VPLWNPDVQRRGIYTNMVARACRTCHVANPELTLRFEQPGTSAGVSFDGRLGQVQERVCREHVMPHARRTHDLFWTSLGPSQPAQLQIYGDSLAIFGWDVVGSSANVSEELLCGQEYTQGGPPIQTAFSPVAQIFSSNGCTGCHSTAFAAQGLNLDPDVAYANIVNIPSTQETTGMPLITPNDPGNSYLVHKIFGTHDESPVMGTGSQMPANRACTDHQSCLNNDDETNALLDWINTGALP
jgi:hypothetical protein